MTDERKTDDARTREQEEELAAYEKLRQEIKNLLAEIRENVNAETIKQTVDEAGARLKEVGGYTAEVLSKASDALKKDLASTAQRLGPKWEAFSESAVDIFEVWRDRGTNFVSEAAIAVGEWLQKTGERIEHQIYRTGEITYGGTFECTACGAHTVLPRPGHLPPCRNCMKTEFRRV